jgi:putative glutamine amidotransferase
VFTSWALRRAGAKPVRVRPRRGAPDRFDGLVVGGGADVTPMRYRASPRRPPSARYRRSRTLPRLVLDYSLAPFIGIMRRLFGLARGSAGPDPARDALELELIARAEAADLPVLGICRGAQLLNIHGGGTLHQDLSGFYTERPSRWTVFPVKKVDIAGRSRLRAVLGRARCEVNSLHRQAVDAIGTGLAVVARDDRGVVQGIEHAARRFWIGVQWHPEYLPQVPEQRRLFAALVDAARKTGDQLTHMGS